MPRLRNIKQENYCQNVIKKDGNLRQAYLEAYPNASIATANTKAYTLMDKPHIFTRVTELLEKNKRVELGSLIDRLADKLEATKQTQNKDGDILEQPDNAIQLNTIQYILDRLYRLKSDGAGIINQDNRVLNITLDKESIAQLSTIVSEMKQLQNKMYSDEEERKASKLV